MILPARLTLAGVPRWKMAADYLPIISADLSNQLCQLFILVEEKGVNEA